MLTFSVLNQLTDFYKILYECCAIGGHSILVLFDFLIKSNIIPGVKTYEVEVTPLNVGLWTVVRQHVYAAACPEKCAPW
jgi:hypothetical protein